MLGRDRQDAVRGCGRAGLRGRPSAARQAQIDQQLSKVLGEHSSEQPEDGIALQLPFVRCEIRAAITRRVRISVPPSTPPGGHDPEARLRRSEYAADARQSSETWLTHNWQSGDILRLTQNPR